jgi:4-aminobutyrate aminotransferase-like enzyme
MMLNGKKRMVDYRHIKYDQDWFKETYDKFFNQDIDVDSNEKSSQIINQCLNYTSSHGRTKIKPLAFDIGSGPFLSDVDDNVFLDFGSGVYVTNIGHCHPKVSQAISIEAQKLMNCHDYITPVKAAYFEKLSNQFEGVYDNIHLYDNGTTAVEMAIKAARAITGKYEIISCFSDHHGKTAGSASLGRLSSIDNTARLPGYYLVPRPNNYRPLWVDSDGVIDTDQYLSFYDLFIKESTTGNVAAFILEPIQGWGGGIMPPDDFFPKLRKFCDERGILLIIDEVLTGCGRTGKWLCLDHWDVKADMLIMGKGIGNGFPIAAMITTSNYAETISKIGPSTSFGGNPMACGAGLATLEVFQDESILENSTIVGDYLLNELLKLKSKYSFIGDVRGKGCLLIIEFNDAGLSGEMITSLFYHECINRKLIPGIPVINLIRIAPPLIIDKAIMDHAITTIRDCLDIVLKKI